MPKESQSTFLVLAAADLSGFQLGHREMKTTERYIRANRLTKEVGFVQSVHKLATNEERPQIAAAVSA
jgi:hypothetical protein